MSVVLKDLQSEKLMLLTKGADSIIQRYIASDQNQNMEDCLKHMEKFAKQGLRTLLLAKRDLDPDFYTSWASEFNQASCALNNRERKLEDVAAKIE